MKLTPHALKLLFFIFVFTLTGNVLRGQITRVEPPFWWTDMHRSEIQIMFYGPNIADAKMDVSPKIVVQNIRKTENPNYVFVTIDTKDLTPQTLQFTFTQGRKKHQYAYELKPRRENSRLRKSFDASDVMYLIMPDRFANGDPSNDSHPKMKEKANRDKPGGRHGGDVQGVINHLDYLADLGVTALWSTPLCADDDENYSYHTYGQSDVYQIDPRYGTNEDYVRLSKEAKKRNIKLIKDYVTNHWGAQHWMLFDLPTYDWIHQFPGYGQTNYRMTTQFDPNASKIDAKMCMDGWFVRSMPDLNQSNPLVNTYLIQNAIWWIEYADLDGFRVDTYSYCDKTAIAEWTKAITDEYPYFNIVGEIWMHDQAQMAYWQKDSKIGAIQSYNSHLPSVMDFTLHNAFGVAFNEHEATWDKGMIRFYENFANDFLYPNIDNILVFFENHDTHRFNHLYPDFETYKMALTLLMTVRGIPQIYYGSEIGMAGNKDKGDADIRQDFPGGWANDLANAFTESGRNAMQKQYFEVTKRLLNWRKNTPVVHFGKMTHYIPENNVYVYFRHRDHEAVMVVINNSQKEQNLQMNRFNENLKPFKTRKNIETGSQDEVNQSMVVPAKSALVFELK